MPSTIGQDAAGPAAGYEHAHHPGPMLFWALAVPERLAGSSPTGILVGTALVNAAAVVVFGIATARLLGRRAAVGPRAPGAALIWALRRQGVGRSLDPYIPRLAGLALGRAPGGA